MRDPQRHARKTSAPAAPRLALAVLLAAAALAGPLAAVAGLAAADRAGAPVLAVAPPWADLPAIVRSAGGRPIGPFSSPLTLLAVGDRTDFPARLRAAGAWLALDGDRIAQLCGADP